MTYYSHLTPSLNGHKNLSFLYSWCTPISSLFKNSHSDVISGRSGLLESTFNLEWEEHIFAT